MTDVMLMGVTSSVAKTRNKLSHTAKVTNKCLKFTT